MQNYNLKLKNCLNKIILTFCIVILIFTFSFFNLAVGAAPSELKNSIDQKTQELLEITSQIKENQKSLEETQGQSKTLQQEVKRIDSNITAVSLSIRSSQVTIDKLGLEINSLQYDISDTEQQIIDKQDAITKILQEFQQTDQETPLIIFLKNKSLADSVLEIQNLADLNSGLSTEMNDLKNTKTALSDKLKQSADKKQLAINEAQNLKDKQLILGETKKEKQTVLVQTKNQEQVYQKTISDLQKKQAAIASEIENMDEELRLKIDPSALPSKRPGVLAMPVSGILSQDYGATTFAKYGYLGKWHNGVDFAASIGTPIFSAEKGKVVAVGNSDAYCYRGAYGKFIVIEHENNLTTLYGHLSLQVVKVNDTINRGQLIGYTGKTGYATGPHLHFSVYASQTFRMGASKTCGLLPYGGDLNPMDYL